MTFRAYIDSSAAVTLALRHRAHHDELTRWLSDNGAELGATISSKLLALEVHRYYVNSQTSENRLRQIHLTALDAVLSRMALVDVSDVVLEAAKRVAVPIKSLDSIHVATAMTHACKYLVTYDAKMAQVADHLGMLVVSPGVELA